VKATPDQFTALAQFPALEGKTWNHPMLAGDVLLVCNDYEMGVPNISRGLTKATVGNLPILDEWNGFVGAAEEAIITDEGTAREQLISREWQCI
jgi:hypothetical protein